MVGQHRHAEEQRPEDDGHRGQRRGRVLGLGLAEGGHAVGDGLDAGEGHGAGGEAPQDEEQRERAARLAHVLGSLGVERHRVDVAEEDAEEPVADQQRQGDDVDVGRERRRSCPTP